MNTKSLYLILAATAVVITCEPQRNNDIIWYPVDDEDGVFISTFGEKRRTPSNGELRSHRRARYSGMEQPLPLPLSYDPSENYDPSFFHNIRERPTIPNIPPSFQHQQFPVVKPSRRPQGQGNQNLIETNFQNTIDEGFEYSKNPTNNEYPGGRPDTTNKWNNIPGNQWQRPDNQKQWNLRPESQWGGNQNQWQGAGSQWGGNQNQWQGAGSQWGSNTGSFVNSGQRPGTSNQWGGSRPNNRPTNSEWVTPNRPGSNGPSDQSDKLVFPGESSTMRTTTTTASTTTSEPPTESPTPSPCERKCPVTPEYNPVCGTDAMTYSNAGRLKCAQMCGKNVRLSHYGNCGPRTPFITPLVSRPRFGQHWF